MNAERSSPVKNWTTPRNARKPAGEGERDRTTSSERRLRRPSEVASAIPSHADREISPRSAELSSTSEIGRIMPAK